MGAIQGYLHDKFEGLGYPSWILHLYYHPFESGKLKKFQLHNKYSHMLLISWFTMTNMKVNLIAYIATLGSTFYRFLLPSIFVVNHEWCKKPQRCHHLEGSNPTRTRTPLRWCEKIPSWLSHAMSCWDSGFVDSGLWQRRWWGKLRLKIKRL